MASTPATTVNRPAWVELVTSDAAAAGDFYARLFGWQVEVSPDPQYGGYGIAKLGGAEAAGIGPKQSPEAPNNWGLYFGTADVEATARKVEEAGGTVVAAPFDVGDQGRMAVFQDPSGAFFSVWQESRMRGFATGAPNAFGWAELNARVSTRRSPSTAGSSAGQTARARSARASRRTPSSRSVARAWLGPGR